MTAESLRVIGVHCLGSGPAPGFSTRGLIVVRRENRSVPGSGLLTVSPKALAAGEV